MSLGPSDVTNWCDLYSDSTPPNAMHVTRQMSIGWPVECSAQRQPIRWLTLIKWGLCKGIYGQRSTTFPSFAWTRHLRCKRFFQIKTHCSLAQSFSVSETLKGKFYSPVVTGYSKYATSRTYQGFHSIIHATTTPSSPSGITVSTNLHCSRGDAVKKINIYDTKAHLSQLLVQF